MGYWIAAYGAPLVAIVVLYGIVNAQAARRTGSRPTNQWLLPVAVLAAFFVTVQGVYDHLAARLQDKVASVFFLLGAILFWGVISRRVGRMRRIKAASPFPHPLIAGCTNGSIGYIPTPEAYDEGGYEVTHACRVDPGAGQMIEAKAGRLLRELGTAFSDQRSAFSSDRDLDFAEADR